ncbi:MAG: M14 family zinc carboxypeptidase, partial [candidate division WOR-3 bacterium]
MVLLILALVSVDPRYHTYEETAQELRALAEAYPSICRLETLGYSTTNHWPLLCLKLSDCPNVIEDEPRLLYNGVHHGAELIGNEVCLFIASDLLRRYERDSAVRFWLDSNQVFIVPLVNPDGHAINMNDLDTTWRKNTHDFNGNGRWDPDTDGVDLNRNYDFLWSAGDSTQGSRYYRGPAPFSEEETRAIRRLAEREQFMFDVCMHSDIDPTRGQTVYFPWRWGNGFCPDYPEIKTIAESVARRIRTDDGARYYACIYGRATEGGLARNWLYYALGTFAYTIEISQGYQPPGEMIDSICQRVSQGAYYLLERTRGSGITGHIRDSATGLPLRAEVRVLEATSTPDTVQPRMSDSVFGRFWHPLRPGTYSVLVSCPGYTERLLTGVNVEPGLLTRLEIGLAPGPGVEELRYAGNCAPAVQFSS